MKVSIVTICYNNASDIRPTIESVVNQTYKNIEYIIVDGASKDNTLEIVNEYKSKISTIISEPDKGLYDAINKGIKAATGDIVGLIHAGDRLHDDSVIEEIVKFFRSNNIDISYGSSRIVNAAEVTKRINKTINFNPQLVRWGWMPSHQSIYIKRELFDKYGYYRLDLGGSADYEFVIRYLYKYSSLLKIKSFDRFIIKFSLGGQSTTNYRKRIQKKHRDIIKQCWKCNDINPPLAIVYKQWLWKIRQFLIAVFK